MGKHSHTNSGLGGFMNGASIRFSKMRGGTGGVDAWRDQLASAYRGRAGARARTTGTAVPVLNSVHSGTVVSVQDFGAFVQLGTGDTYKDGLLHISCLAGFRPERVDEVVDVGAKVWVKVSEVKHEEGKYSLDMRYVHQKDGKDLDPHNTRGRLPDNGTSVQAPEPPADAPGPPGARASGSRDLLPAKAAAQAAPHSGASLQDGRTAPTKRKKSARDAQLDSEEGSGDEDASDSDLAEQQKKMKKKLKKAAKKLEKAKRKAEKAKARKAEKAKDKKKTKKKKKKASSDDSSSDGASTDSS